MHEKSNIGPGRPQEIRIRTPLAIKSQKKINFVTFSVVKK